MVVQAGKHKYCGRYERTWVTNAAADFSRLPALPSDLGTWRLLQKCT